ncbi:MAG: glucosaminidase domain-containing protein [Bacillota bacterium]
MRIKKITRLQFMLVSCLSLTVILSLTHIFDLRREHTALREAIGELTAAYNEQQSLVEQLEVYHEQVNGLLARNEALEEILLNRVRSYLVATEGLSSYESTAPLPSRSGYEESASMINMFNMSMVSESGFTEADFEYIWHIYRAENLKGTGAALISAEQNSGINALLLAAIIVHESHWGKSPIARDKNNLAGLGAFDGSAYSSAMAFSSKADCILYLADLLKHQYLTPGGRHYKGPHLLGIGQGYASDPLWPQKVADKMIRMVLTVVDHPDEILSYARDRL